MALITPATATIATSTTRSLSADFTPNFWKIKSGGGSLSGVSGANATYNAPSSPTSALIRAETTFWTITYNPSSNGSIDSQGRVVIANDGFVYADGAAKILTANCGFRFIVTPSLRTNGQAVGIRADLLGDPTKKFGRAQDKFTTLVNQNPDFVIAYYKMSFGIFAQKSGLKQKFYQLVSEIFNQRINQGNQG